MRYWRWLGFGVLGLILALAVADAVYFAMTLPKGADPAEFANLASRYDVRIVRDSYGVPHIFGHTDADTAFGLGFAHSEDDFETIQEVALATRGTLAQSSGISAATTDYLVHFLRIWDTVHSRYERDLPRDFRRVLQAYADGVNTYASRHPEMVKRGLLPLTGEDVAAGFVFKTPFFYGLDGTLKKILNPPKPDTKLPVGSNGAAVAPSRSADGATRLLVNSHQPYTGAVAWYEAVLESGEGWHVAGGFFPGSPFMLHGHNAHLGWANTVNAPDLADVYRLVLNPADPNQYKLDGRWVNFTREDAAITVKLWAPFYWTVHRPVLFSVQGPVLKTDHGAFAIRYAGMNEIRQSLQYYRLDKARDRAEWLGAMAMGALPSVNYIYADEKGNIGYVYNGEFPVRKPGFDWKSELPGDRSDLVWHTYLPFAKEPQVWNPKSGFLFNSNNTPFAAGAGNDDLKPDAFPKWMGIQTNMTNRAYRALETFGSDPAISAASFRQYKFDLSYSPRSELAKEVAEILAIDPGADQDLRTAQSILRSWNRKTDRHNRATALAVLMGVRAAPEEQGGPRKTRPIDALQKAIRLLKNHFGRLDPEWGQVNRMRRGTIDVPIDGGPDIYRAVYGKQQKDGTLTAGGGDTLIMFVTWDRNGKLSSESIHQFGSATQDSTSKHYADQVPLFVAMKTKPVWFTAEALKRHIEKTYRPGEMPAPSP